MTSTNSRSRAEKGTTIETLRVRLMGWWLTFAVWLLAGCPRNPPVVEQDVSTADNPFDAGVMDSGVTSDGPVAEDVRIPRDLGPREDVQVRCEVGAIYACICEDRRSGVQRCQESLDLTACQCPSGDGGLDGSMALSLPPRLLSPLTAMRVTSRRPTLRWALPTGISRARVELCHDRPCTRMITRMDVTGERVRPSEMLPPGVVFWRVHGLRADDSAAWTSATWEFWVGQRDAPVDTSYGVMKDFNGDGYDDIAVSTLSTNPRGIVEVFYGSLGGVNEPSRQVLRAPQSGGEQFAETLEPAGDFNGDGYADLLVGESHFRGLTGMGDWLYLGSNSGLPAVASRTFAFREGDTFKGFAAGSDLNGDGFCDIIIMNLSTGFMHLYWGSAGGGTQMLSLLQAPYYSSTAFGMPGDVNADGYGDLLVGAPTARGGQGQAYLFLGGPRGPRPTYNELYPRETGGTSIGAHVTGNADFNGDSFHDFVIGTAGAILIYFGGERLPSPAELFVLPEQEPSVGVYVFGTTNRVGDPNGDGYGDLIAGVPGAPGEPTPNADQFGAGSVYVYYGTASGLRRTPQVQLRGDRSFSGFGLSVVAANDLNRDGFDDVVVGVRNPGEVRVFWGRSDVLRADYDQLIPYRNEVPRGSFGARLALNQTSTSVLFNSGDLFLKGGL